MSSTKTDHYFRLLTLLLEAPTKALLEFLLHRAGCPFSDLDTYLQCYQSTLKIKLPRYQYDRLFGSGTQIEKNIFDISLSCILLDNLFTLSTQEKQWIKNIKDTRNDLFHRCDSFEINEIKFKKMWLCIMDATKGLAGKISFSYLQEMTDIIEDVKQRSLPPPGPYKEILKDVLSTMNDTISELNGTINELRDGMKTLTESNEKNTSILNNTVHVVKRTGEPVRKKMKILDPNLERMQESFKKTMDALPDDFTASSESNDMMKKLKESRRLYVAGSDSSQYLQTALYVIKLLGIDVSRCVEMKGCSDWKHVNSDDVGLVLLRDPFGNNNISSKLIGETHNCLDNIYTDNFKTMPLTDRMFVIITSEYGTHLQYMDKCFEDPHDILADIVVFQKPTTEADPHVITDERHSLTFETDTCSQLKTLKEHTNMYVDYYARKEYPANRFEDAKQILKQHKMLAIYGPLHSGKTSLATKLMASFASDRSVLLKTHFDMSYIRFGDVSIVLVEDFTGKYALNEQTASEWYGVFDFLLPAVMSGKLSVIVTSDAEHFRICQLPTHDLLRHDITLTKTVLPVVKLEPGSAAGDAYMMVNASTSRTGLKKSLRNASFEDRKTFHVKRKKGFIIACTCMPSGHIIIAHKSCVVLMDIDFKFMSQEDVHFVSNIATVNDTSVIAACVDQYLHYIDVNLSASQPSLTFGKRINVGEYAICTHVDVNDTDIYVLCNNRRLQEIHVLHKGSEIIHNTISINALGLTRVSHMKVSPNCDRVYVTSCAKVICIGTRGKLVYKYPNKMKGGMYMYVDNEDNLLVVEARSNNIIMIDKDGKKLKKLFTESHEMIFPICFCYREIDSCLVVVCIDETILTFKCKW